MIDRSFPIAFKVLDSTFSGILAEIFPSIIVKSGEMEHSGSADGISIQSPLDERIFTHHRMQDRQHQQPFRVTIVISSQLCFHISLNGSKPSGASTKTLQRRKERYTIRSWAEIGVIFNS